MKILRKALIIVIILGIISFAGYYLFKLVSPKTSGGKQSNKANSYTAQMSSNGKKMVKFYDMEATFADCSKEEILNAVAQFHKQKYGESDITAELDSIDGDIWRVLIFKYENGKKYVCDYYDIDRLTLDGMHGEERVSIGYLLNREPVYIYVEDTPALRDRHGHRADGTYFEFNRGETTDNYKPTRSDNTTESNRNTGNQSSGSNNNSKASYVLREGTFYAGYKEGQLRPGTYGLKVEGEHNKYFAHFQVQHKHQVIDSYRLGMAESHDALFNKGILDFYVSEGDYIKYAVSVGEPKVTIYQK